MQSLLITDHWSCPSDKYLQLLLLLLYYYLQLFALYYSRSRPHSLSIAIEPSSARSQALAPQMKTSHISDYYLFDC